VVIVNKEDPYQWVYKDLPKKHHMLRKVPICEYCGSLRFSSKTPAFCYRKGKVHIYVHDLPFEIRHLFDSQTDCDAKYFRHNIHYFNSHFSFTSFGATVDERTATVKGIYRFVCIILLL
jgi:hypothetical protein